METDPPWTTQGLTAALGADAALASGLLARRPARVFGASETELVATLRSTGQPPSTWLDLDLEGLVLSRACLRHDAAALRVLDGELLGAVATALRRRASGDDVDEALQLLRSRLLLGDAPKLAQYSGRGPLGAFLRIAGSHVLSNLRPAVPNRASGDELAALPDATELESRLVRKDQQERFRAVFREAVQALTARERSLLRLSLLDGLSIDDIAPMYGAHRASVARWLSAARDRLSAITRARLAVALELPEDDVDRLLRSVQNGFELSLSRALREP
ncbi:MAG: sigma factor-like helix-turn-helix DNA-binding protein [Myxococcaceae bacterium]|nr:sigma factor-like helix-turn-helix DNA-binding protein [Myxococcaceae bacterium]